MTTNILPNASDRELLELAAKAAGIEYHIDMLDGCEKLVSNGAIWNPLFNDGDEARLEAALELDVVWWLNSVEVGECIEQFINHNGDKQAARRRAGTRAAAAIGAAK